MMKTKKNRQLVCETNETEKFIYKKKLWPIGSVRNFDGTERNMNQTIIIQNQIRKLKNLTYNKKN